MCKIEIKIPATDAKSYDITVGNDVLSSLLDRLENDFAQKNWFIVTDANLSAAGHLKTLLGERGIPTFIIDPAGETSKHIDTVVSIIEMMEQAALGRDSMIAALGGGTVGDIAGFAASIFKRGIGVVHIPTTTVAQADSAVGGKTGVDSTISKNAFGTFWQPAAVYIDTSTLKTLDNRQYNAGLVESVKHALIADEKYFQFLEDNIDAVLDRSPDILAKMAFYNCRIKGAVVEKDPTEKNQRRMLNYGHTIGHAVETVSGFELLHGEAVAIGIIAAGLIETELGLAKPKQLDRIKNILSKLNMPLKIGDKIQQQRVFETLKLDKKSINKWPKFVLIDKIGSVFCQNNQWAVDVDQQLVKKILAQLY